jgi:hypothetical protein
MANSILQCAAAFGCDCFHAPSTTSVATPAVPGTMLGYLGGALALFGMLGLKSRRRWLAKR